MDLIKNLKWEPVFGCFPITPTKESHRSVGVLNPNSRGHTEEWESLTPNKGATPKRGSPWTQLKGLHRSVGTLNPTSRGHTKVWVQNQKWPKLGNMAMGAFSHSARTARTTPVITVFTPVTALKTCHL